MIRLLTLEKLIKKITVSKIKRGFPRFISLHTELDMLSIVYFSVGIFAGTRTGRVVSLCLTFVAGTKCFRDLFCFAMLALTCSKGFQFF